ncbi:VOC family protein [Streptomyces sp. NPDC127164]|uniref:VOC family protein n=1 Tax=Streptomyces sp. NPDC127164 TaxID=3345379 RepID=UPI0036411D4B
MAKADAETEAAPRILLSLDVDSVDETLGRVKALGGSVRSAPKDMPWGQRVAHISDPDGNPANLTQPIRPPANQPRTARPRSNVTPPRSDSRTCP